jgi:hypothetical protein
MLRRTAGILALSVLVVLVPSCTRLPGPSPSLPSLADEQVPAGGVIPEGWGSLVAVSSATGFPDLVQLWFQDREGTVRMAVLNLSTHRIITARLIRRK